MKKQGTGRPSFLQFRSLRTRFLRANGLETPCQFNPTHISSDLPLLSISTPSSKSATEIRGVRQVTSTPSPQAMRVLRKRPRIPAHPPHSAPQNTTHIPPSVCEASSTPSLPICLRLLPTTGTNRPRRVGSPGFR